MWSCSDSSISCRLLIVVRVLRGQTVITTNTLQVEAAAADEGETLTRLPLKNAQFLEFLSQKEL